MGINIEHVLLFIVAVFLLHHLMGNCGCANSIDGFNIGGQKNPCPLEPKDPKKVTKWQSKNDFDDCQCPEDWIQQKDGYKDPPLWRCLNKTCPLESEGSKVTQWQNKTDFRNCQCPENWTEQKDGYHATKWRCEKTCPLDPKDSNVTQWQNKTDFDNCLCPNNMKPEQNKSTGKWHCKIQSCPVDRLAEGNQVNVDYSDYLCPIVNGTRFVCRNHCSGHGYGGWPCRWRCDDPHK